MIEIKHKNFRKKFMFLDILFLNLFFDWYSYHYLLNKSTSNYHFIFFSKYIVLHLDSRMYYFSKSYICYLITTLMLIFLKISSVPMLSPMIDLRWWEIGKLVEDTNFLLLFWTILSGPPSSSSSLVTPCGGNFRQD